MPALLEQAGELGLLDGRHPRAARRPRPPQDDVDARRRARPQAARRSASRGARTPASARCRSSTTAPRSRSSATCRSSRPARWLAAYALTEPGSGSDALARQDRARVRDRRRLSPDRHEAVHHQRRLRRPVHRLRQGRRREVHRVPRRARHARASATGPEEHKLGIRGSSTRQLILEDVAGARRRTCSARSAGPQDRVQHPEHRPLQARRRRGRRGARSASRSRSTTRATASSSAADRELRHDPAQARRHGDAHLRRRHA